MLFGSVTYTYRFVFSIIIKQSQHVFRFHIHIDIYFENLNIYIIYTGRVTGREFYAYSYNKIILIQTTPVSSTRI